MKTASKVLLGLGGLLVFGTGCAVFGQPGVQTNFLAVDEDIEKYIIRAAADWARHGLEIANYVTVNDGKGGVPVRLVSDEELFATCTFNPPPDLGGCASWSHGDWEQIVVKRSLPALNRAIVVLHEIIHVLVPKATHTPGYATGAFCASGNGMVISKADMEHLAKFTEVRDTGIEFLA